MLEKYLKYCYLYYRFSDAYSMYLYSAETLKRLAQIFIRILWCMCVVNSPAASDSCRCFRVLHTRAFFRLCYIL